MKNRIPAVFAGLLVFGLASPTRANALPTCTTISVVMLPGYQCQIGGLMFDHLGWGMNTYSQGLASFSGPSSYDLDFSYVDYRVVVTYRPVGASLLTAAALTDPSAPDLTSVAYIIPGFQFNVTVAPSRTRLIGAFAKFGSVGLTAFGPGYSHSFGTGYFAASDLHGRPYGYGSGGPRYFNYYGSAFASPLASGSGTCDWGTYNPVYSTAPLSIGNLFCTAIGPGSSVHFVTQQAVAAYALSYNTGAAAATASAGAGWSTTLYVAPVPEPATWALLATGLAAIGFITWRRHRHA